MEDVVLSPFTEVVHAVLKKKALKKLLELMDMEKFTDDTKKRSRDRRDTARGTDFSESSTWTSQTRSLNGKSKWSDSDSTEDITERQSNVEISENEGKRQTSENACPINAANTW